MSTRFYLNQNWMYAEDFNDFSKATEVSIPHSVSITQFNYFDEGIYQKVSGYKRNITIPKEWNGKKVALVFEGVAHKATVYVNGEERTVHESGYTAFEVDITKEASEENSIEIMVKVDSRENLNQPPFGFVIDYMTYGGIYRDVYARVSEIVNIEDIFFHSVIEGSKVSLVSDIKLCNPYKEKLTIYQTVNGVEYKEKISDNEFSLELHVGDVDFWDIDNPRLYKIVTKIYDEYGHATDVREDCFGFRKSEFKKDGYYLNGRKVKIRGLNRHQCYPYVGYAMPESMQKLDADILKFELGVNAVRTSHYPQSQAFISRCDEIGLLVFTEIPGWQHIGDEEWKNVAVQNVKEMIVQYRNHPSIILWGVRINESVDDDEFYKRTNAVAHECDPTRPTGGVRASKKSHLFEDVYTYNDFIHDGKHPGCEKKRKITSNNSKPYLISEYNGHMFPTKTFDCEEHKREHAIRHANVLDAVSGEKDIAGSFGWCMFDYNTHKDFGSGDRICYHGVTDMFRNPKLAAYVYASQKEPMQESSVVLEISSSMDIGEHPGCNRGDTWIFSNADSVRMYKNDRFVKEYTKKDSPYKNMKYGPILIDDYVGDIIEKEEGIKKSVCRDINKVMNATAFYGVNNLPFKTLLTAAKLIVFNHMKMDDAVSLYTKYVGDWGGKSTVYRFDAVYNGKVVKSVVKAPVMRTGIEATASHTRLVIGNTYDVALVRLKAVDQNGNVLPFFDGPVSFETEGPISIIGPRIVSLKGGMFGVYVKTVNETGEAKLVIKSDTTEPVTVDFEIIRD